MFGKNTKVDLELNREVEQLLKTGGKERILPIVQAGEPVLRQQTVQYSGQLSKGTLNKLIDTNGYPVVFQAVMMALQRDCAFLFKGAGN